MTDEKLTFTILPPKGGDLTQKVRFSCNKCDDDVLGKDLTVHAADIHHVLKREEVNVVLQSEGFGIG